METKRGMDIPRFFAVLQVFNIFWESFLMEKGGGGKAMIVDSITGIKKEEYIKEQNELIRKINLNNTVDLEKIHLVAGVDLAYWRDENGGEQAVCCIVVLDYKTKNTVEKVSCAQKVEVPYIPGCLAYRELPVFLKAYRKLVNKPEVIFLTGTVICIQGIWGLPPMRAFSLTRRRSGWQKHIIMWGMATLLCRRIAPGHGRT